MSTCHANLWLIELDLPADAEPAFEEYAAIGELRWSSTRHPDALRTTIQVFADSATEAEHVCADLTAELPAWLGGLDDAAFAPKIRTLAREDWAETWKRFFHVQRVTPRLVIRPSWEAYQPQPGEQVLELDPGMSFGTGYHGTTRACLEMIDLLSVQLPGTAFLDAGCGSSILALAAAKLGFSPVRAFDSDPQAVVIARENLERNHVTVRVDVADLGAYHAAPPNRVVVANILAPVLLANAEKLVSFLDRQNGDSYLILSGILTPQYPEIRQRFQALGGQESGTRTLDEWTSGGFRFLPSVP